MNKQGKLFIVLKKILKTLNKNIHKISSQELIKDLYQQDYQPRLANGQLFEIPIDGSLGLLATGYTGLIAWRKKRGMKK